MRIDLGRAGVWAHTLSWLCACTPAPAQRAQAPLAETRPAKAPAPLERFLPLLHDTVFSYSVWLPESREPEQLILQAERHSTERANLRSGNSIKRLLFVDDGIRLVTGGYLLKAPLELGASWAGPAGRVSVTAVDRDVSVQAGRFVGCVETTEKSANSLASRSILTTYCPDVGIVKFSVGDGDREERYELRSFGPRVDVNAL